MATQRRLVILAVGLVCVAAIAIPVARLASQWMAISALERDTVFMEIEPPYVSRWIDAEWPHKLCGTVRAVELEGQATVQDARCLRSLRGLQVLIFDGAPDAAWSLLPTQLTELHLTRGENGLSPTALRQLAEMRLLKRLSIHSGPPCDEALVQALEKLPRLRVLEFGGMTVPQAHLQKLLMDHPQLEEFAIRGTASFTDADVEVITRHSHISKLSLQENLKLTEACLPSLAEMKSLRELFLDLNNEEDSVREWFLKRRPDLTVNPLQELIYSP